MTGPLNRLKPEQQHASTEEESRKQPAVEATDKHQEGHRGKKDRSDRFAQRTLQFRLQGTLHRHLPERIEEGSKSRYRSEEHTSELQSRENLVCRPLREK